MSILSSSSVVNLMIGPKIKCRSSIKNFRDLRVIPTIASTDFKESINNFSKKLNDVEIDKLSANLNKTVEEVIIDYYNSDEFEEFRANEEIIEYDGAFYKEKKFSLLQDYGFLRLIKGHY